MAAVTHIIINHDSGATVAGIRDALASSSSHSVDPKQFASSLENLAAGLACGAKQGGVEVIINDVTTPAKATAEITITHANLTAGDTVSIGFQAITARAAGAVANEFNIGADATADAAALAAAINASATLSPFFLATSAAGVVTVACRFTGALGNFIGLTTSDATAYGLSAARFGTGGAAVSGGTLVTGVRKIYNFGTAQT